MILHQPYRNGWTYRTDKRVLCTVCHAITGELYTGPWRARSPSMLVVCASCNGIIHARCVATIYENAIEYKSMCADCYLGDA